VPTGFLVRTYGAIGLILSFADPCKTLFLLACCYFSQMAYILPLFGHPTSRPARSHASGKGGERRMGAGKYPFLLISGPNGYLYLEAFNV
jgi:hypothetical protein